MRSMVEGGSRIRHGCVARLTPSTIAFGDSPLPVPGKILGPADPHGGARYHGRAYTK